MKEIERVYVIHLRVIHLLKVPLHVVGYNVCAMSVQRRNASCINRRRKYLQTRRRKVEAVAAAEAGLESILANHHLLWNLNEKKMY